MIRLVVLGGTGDAYLVSALYDQFRRRHGRTDVTIVTRAKFATVPAMLFGLPVEENEKIVWRGENDLEFQRNHPNDPTGDLFYCHPCMLRSPTRVDALTTKPDASQADMYRMMMQLAPTAPLALPTVPIRHDWVRGSVLLLREAVSWPNTQPRFWDALKSGLRARGWTVAENNPSWNLQDLLICCAGVEWVIGPQCGVMSILCTGQFPCRKTLATPSVDDTRAPSFLAPETYPYAYVTKFANHDYDVEEFKITHANHAEIVDAICHGQNALRLWPHDPRPVATLQAPITSGDAMDRFAVLTVKRARFPAQRRAAIEREYRRYEEVTRRMMDAPELRGLFARLVHCHERTFDVLERLVPAVAQRGEDGAIEDHRESILLNRERVDLKREIDAAARAPYREVKSYYGPEGI